MKNDVSIDRCEWRRSQSRNPIRLKEGYNNISYKKGEGCSLIIKNVEYVDNGKWSCKVQSHGKDYEMEGHVTVIGNNRFIQHFSTKHIRKMSR